MSRGLSQHQLTILEKLQKGAHVISELNDDYSREADDYGHSVYTSVRRAVRSLEKRGLVKIFEANWWGENDRRGWQWVPDDGKFPDDPVMRPNRRVLLTVEITDAGRAELGRRSLEAA